MDGNALMRSLPVQRFCRQYLQAEPNPDFPTDRALLRSESVQEYFYTTLFSPEACTPKEHQLPPSYALRILKRLISAIEASIDDWDEHAVSDNLLEHFANFSSASTASFAVRKHRVIYSVSALDRSASTITPSITFLENRATISAGGTTGIRTWEAALHLGEYLCREQPTLVRGKRVLELGAGTGYVSILCVKHLGAAECVATDGSLEVVNSLPVNLELNGLDAQTVVGRELAWGPTLPEWAADSGDPFAFDVVVGADITFDARDMPDLLATVHLCLAANKEATVLISATERNKTTFDTFMQLAAEQSLRVVAIDFPVIPRRDQTGPFYSDVVPIHICQLSVM